MKIILSRKGCDQKWGGVPSPILHNMEMCSLPIPVKKEARRLGEVRFRGQPLSTLTANLSSKLSASTRVHLDPDLRSEAVPRRRGWRPTFGQVNAAQRHLENQKVGVGDLFLFFGWFRETQDVNGDWSYKRGSPHMHVLFGWLQVGDVIRLTDPDAVVPAWAIEHPHVLRKRSIGMGNTLYVAAPRLRVPGTRYSLAGGGVFPRFRSELALTVGGQKCRSLWRLPHWLMPRRGKKPLTYHGNPERWSRHRGECTLRTVAVGQEFVFDTDEYPEALAWLRQLFTDAT